MSHDRRTVLRGLGSIAIVGGLAGCIGDGGTDGDDSTPDATESPTPDATESETPTPEGTDADATVTLVSNEFQPDFLVVEAGATVEFVGESGTHTVTAYHSDNGRQHRVPDGTEAFDIPMEEGDRETLTFDTEGVYDYHCKPHESVGMVGSILVGDADENANGLAAPDESDLPEAAAAAIRELNDEARAELGLETATDGGSDTGTETKTDDGGGGGYY